MTARTTCRTRICSAARPLVCTCGSARPTATCPTLRTQVSFTAGIAELGGFPLSVDGKLARIGERESIEDTARVLGRQVAAIVWRTFSQKRLEQMVDFDEDQAVSILKQWLRGGVQA